MLMSNQTLSSDSRSIPRSEYPRPDWQRSDWLCLNGEWSFQFDPDHKGIEQGWPQNAEVSFESTIQVPFSWSSPLSGIGSNEKGIGWYRRSVQWTPAQNNTKLFLRFGAVDYTCDVWINGNHVGTHAGGYGTFEFDVSEEWMAGGHNQIVVRTEDFDLDSQARGKQGYGEIRGIWQPVWLEARPGNYVKTAKFTTRLDGNVEVAAVVDADQAGKASLSFSFEGGRVRHQTELELKPGINEIRTRFTVPNPQLWSPDDPHLYEGEVSLRSELGVDSVSTYFGIREIETALIGDRTYRWILLNGKPVYLNGALDQSYHRTGYFTYPTDQDMYDEIFQMKRIGLNLVRIHIKPEEPRKLYWADKLGVMVMEDMPCFWGEPTEQARASYEMEAQEVIDRDFNHPSIISWVMFNETWGLKTSSQSSSLTGDSSRRNHYLPETQEWVRNIYLWAKQMDPTRIIEDNSPCNQDHVETDLNTWHFYINGYEQVRNHLIDITAKTFPGSTHNYIGGNCQSDAPLMNSECGNVWGIEGGAGDSDLSWHYRYMINEFRRHDQLCGFVFTEFRDVVNEFNGYYRLDGSDKQFGYDWFVPGMSLADLHSPDFIVIDAPPCQTVVAGAEVCIPLLRSCYSDRHFGQVLELNWELWFEDASIRKIESKGSIHLAWDGYGVSQLPMLNMTMPKQDAVAVLALQLRAPNGQTVMRNFTTFDVRSHKQIGAHDSDQDHGIVHVPVASFAEHNWEYQWNALQDHKVNGGSKGQFIYEIQLPDQEQLKSIYHIEIVLEASSKRLLTRNKEDSEHIRPDISFMHGAKTDVERNPNTYYMTDAQRHESKVNVLIHGEWFESIWLPDDPADSRGVLSWHYQQVHNKLDEAGSYGYLFKITVPSKIVAKLNQSRHLRLQLESEDGGLAIYGRNAGRYPIDLMIKYSSN